MTAQRDPYVRVYYRIIDDPKFAGVFDDDSRLACWLRLLLVADGTWPAPAPIPASVRRGSFQHLVDVGLIDVVTGGRYRVHGMDSERGERREKARAAAYVMHSGSSASAVQAQSVSSATAEQSQGDSSASRGPRARTAPLHSEPSTPTDTPTPQSGVRMNPRAMGTNPRAVAAREKQRRADLANAIHLRYLRGELTDDQERDERRKAGLTA